MAELRQSFSLWSFAGRGVESPDLLRAAAKIGYAGVELLPPDLWGAARGAGLRVVAHLGHESIGSGLNDPDQHARIIAEINSALALAARHGVPNLIVFSGNRRPGLSDEASAGHTADGLRRVARAAEDAGVTLLLELLNSRIDHAGYQADHTDWGVRVCDAVGSPRVRLLYDIYHMQIMEGDILRTIDMHRPFLGHFHTAGVPGRHDLDGTQELNYPPLVRAIAADGYAGFLGHEFVPKGDPVAALRAAYELCAAAVSE